MTSSRRYYDKIVLGAGLYGLYAALRCGKRGERVCVIERDRTAFSRATYVNQARVHMGYHYPRSLATAIKSAGYFQRFCRDFGFSIMSDFEQVYATSSFFSWTNAAEFLRFCKHAHIMCEEISPAKFFKSGMCDGAFLTTEYTYDAFILRDYFLDELSRLASVDILYGRAPSSIVADGEEWILNTGDIMLTTRFILNATYAAVNNIHRLIGATSFKVKYELCEIILCNVSDRLKERGITVMDGPFFSIMPFGKSGLHSLTSVTFTPHEVSLSPQPTFPCQRRAGASCQPASLSNCNICEYRPSSAWPYMSQLARKYLRDELEFYHERSLYSMKPILQSSEVDDGRPTVVEVISDTPRMVSVLSGKINTVYDLDPYL